MDRTPWNEEWSESVARVGKLISSLFACEVRFQSVEAFLEQARTEELYLEQDLVFFHSRLFTPPDHLRSKQPGTIAFPLRVRRHGANSTDVSLVGVATIERLAATDDQRLTEVGEFLKLAVEAKLDAFERLLVIEQREAELVKEQTERESSKVIQLFPRVLQNLTLPAVTAPVHTVPDSESNSGVLERPLLLQTLPQASSEDSPVAVDRVAVDLFNKTDLWFFVNIEDLHSDAFVSVQSIKELGRMCIFIRDLAVLSTDRQIRIAEAFNHEAMGADGPRLIAATNESLSELVASGRVLEHFARIFRTVEIKAGPSAGSVPSVVSFIVDSIEGKSPRSKLIPLWGHRPPNDDRPPTFH